MKEANTIFSTKEAKQAGLNKQQLKVLVDAGQLIRLNRGIYLRSENEKPRIGICESFESTTLLVGSPSAICLNSALYYYGLLEEKPEQDWIMVPVTKRCAHNIVRVFRTRRPMWEQGIVEKEGFSVTSVERTLVDALTNPKSIDLEIGIVALNLALEKRVTDLHKIISMGGKLNLISRISSIIKTISALK